ncbi:Glucose oxidase [Zalerion maritima]|uniref:Glucose oxidase n=1 Tax=Zalerion maritima TaxID=339359 RepID=A0AAD5RYI4_9PEZI|nr:Glucose oxidase [Zalerion maritima]
MPRRNTCRVQAGLAVAETLLNSQDGDMAVFGETITDGQTGGTATSSSAVILAFDIHLASLDVDVFGGSWECGWLSYAAASCDEVAMTATIATLRPILKCNGSQVRNSSIRYMSLKFWRREGVLVSISKSYSSYDMRYRYGGHIRRSVEQSRILPYENWAQRLPIGQEEQN